MGLLTRLGRTVQAIRKGITPSDSFGWITEHPSWRMVTGGVRGNIRSPYRQSAFVFGAIEGKIRNLRGIPIVVKRGRRDDRSTGQILPSNDPLAKLFDRPSPFYSTAQMIGAIVAWLDLAGEFFLLKYGKSGFAAPNEVPRELLLVPPRWVTLNATDIDTTTGIVRSWTIAPFGRERFPVPAWAVVHGRTFNPDDIYRGLSPLEACSQGIAIEYKADAHTMAVLDNDMTPNGVIAVDQRGTQEVANQILKGWEDMMGGARRKGSPAVMFKGMSWLPVAWTPKDMAMVEQTAKDKSMIRAALGVTQFETGDAADYNRASSVSAKRWLWENTLIPTSLFIQDVLYAGLFRGLSQTYGGDVWMEFDLSNVEALLDGFTDKVGQAQGLLNLGYTLNQVNDRVNLGMPRVAWGDEPNAGIPDLGLGAEVPVEGAPAAIQIEPSSGRPDSGGDAVPVDGQGRAGESAIRVRASAGLRGGPSGRDVPSFRTRAAMPGKTSQATVMRVWHEKAARKMARGLAKFYRDMRDASLARARGMTRSVAKANGSPLPPLSTAELDRILGSPAEWQRIARAFIAANMNAIALSAVRASGIVIGGFDLVTLDDPRWLAMAAQRTAQMVRVATRWRQAIRSMIIEQTAGDVGVVQMADAIQAAFGRVIRSNGMVIARTETGMIGGQIRSAVFAAEGFTSTEWSATNDGHVRDSHRAIDGEVRKQGERFSNGLLYPSEPGGPPEEVIQCRCVALPV